MHISKLELLTKHILIGLLFFSFCAFKPALPDSKHQYMHASFEEINVILHKNGIIELEIGKVKEEVPEPKTKEASPIPTNNIIVDDVMVMLRDHAKEADGLAMSHYTESDSAFPFPG